MRRWSNYMLAHMDEVLASLHREGVRHEAWYLCPGEPLCVIGIMDVTDALAAQKAMSTSSLSVDEVHREFKRHWVHSDISAFEYDPGEYQFQEGAELLFSAHPK
nr:DUF6176 family protein [Salipiger sp. CCB-MM3]